MVANLLLRQRAPSLVTKSREGLAIRGTLETDTPLSSRPFSSDRAGNPRAAKVLTKWREHTREALEPLGKSVV